MGGEGKSFFSREKKFSLSPQKNGSVTAVAAARVIFAVVVVIAVEVFPKLESSVEVSDDDIAYAALCAADDLDSGIGKGVDRAAADTAADEQIHVFGGEQSRQCAVSGIAGREAGFADNLVIGGFKDGETGGMSEVLEYGIVFASYGNFHNRVPYFK